MDYRDLVAWQRSMALAQLVYEQTAKLPREEKYGLTSQMRKAAVSVPSNIAEGQGRRTTDDEFVRFLQIALGSLCELETQVELAVRLNLFNQDVAKPLNALSAEVGRLVNGLIRSKKH